MIRIDEIYYNVFVPALQHQERVGLHWFDPFGSVNIKDICNVPPVDGKAKLRLIFWDQEPVYRDTATAFFDRFVGVYTGPKILVTSERGSDLDWVCDTYALQASHYFFHGWAALDWYRGYDHTYLSRAWMDREFTSKFFCPNNIVGGRRTHRLALLSQLDQHDLIQGNHVSFPAICPYENLPVQDLLRQQGLPDLQINLPLIIDRAANHANHSHKIDFWSQAQQSFCHVVTETAYDDTRLHVTEKSFKPIVLQQPFMILGTPNTLSYLKHYGFRTFEDLWDESYDQASDNDRVKKIVANLIKINAWTPGELLDAQHHAQHIIEHNFQWFYGGFQHVLWNELSCMIQSWK